MLTARWAATDLQWQEVSRFSAGADPGSGQGTARGGTSIGTNFRNVMKREVRAGASLFHATLRRIYVCKETLISVRVGFESQLLFQGMVCHSYQL